MLEVIYILIWIFCFIGCLITCGLFLHKTQQLEKHIKNKVICLTEEEFERIKHIINK